MTTTTKEKKVGDDLSFRCVLNLCVILILYGLVIHPTKSNANDCCHTKLPQYRWTIECDAERDRMHKFEVLIPPSGLRIWGKIPTICLCLSKFSISGSFNPHPVRPTTSVNQWHTHTHTILCQHKSDVFSWTTDRPDLNCSRLFNKFCFMAGLNNFVLRG